MKEVKIQLNNGRLPSKGTTNAACYDLYACFKEETKLTGFNCLIQSEEVEDSEGNKVSSPVVYINPGGRALIPTNIKLELPENTEAQIRPRSGLAIKHGITCLNTPATIDEDYRGFIGIILINHGQDPFPIREGDRVAQLAIREVLPIEWKVVDKLTDTVRGEGGFGHTGTN